MNDILTVKELAEYLRIKPITVYKHVSKGKLPFFKVGSLTRFRKDVIDAWIKSKEIPMDAKRMEEIRLMWAEHSNNLNEDD